MFSYYKGFLQPFKFENWRIRFLMSRTGQYSHFLIHFNSQMKIHLEQIKVNAQFYVKKIRFCIFRIRENMWWTCYRFLGSQFVHNIYKPLDNLDEFIDKYKDDYEKQTIGVGGQSKTIVKDNSKKTWDFKIRKYI